MEVRHITLQLNSAGQVNNKDIEYIPIDPLSDIQTGSSQWHSSLFHYMQCKSMHTIMQCPNLSSFKYRSNIHISV
jgi:hypothetical protein